MKIGIFMIGVIAMAINMNAQDAPSGDYPGGLLWAGLICLLFFSMFKKPKDDQSTEE